MSGVEGISGPGHGLRPPLGRPRPAEGFSVQPGTGDVPGGVEIKAPVNGEIIRSFSTSHPGVDILVDPGVAVRSSTSGVVESAGWAGDRGNMLVVRDRDIRTFYGHLEGFSLRPGDAVEAGQKIGTAGATGATNRPALHFEVHSRGKAVNPELLLSQS